MKTGILILCFSLFSIQLSAQILKFPTQKEAREINRYYRLGTEALKEGNYQLADSLLEKSIKIKAYPNSIYNYSIARLYLGDTATFCRNMREFSLMKQKDATKMYYEYCATADTVFYDRKFQKRPSKKKSKYAEITINDKFLPYKTVYLHMRRRWQGTQITSTLTMYDFIHPTNTNIFTVSRLYPNGNKVYTYIQGIYNKYKNDTSLSYNDSTKRLLQATKKQLKLKNAWAEVEFIVNKNGDIIHDTIIVSNVPKKVLGHLQKRIGKIFINRVKTKPVAFRHKHVMFCIDQKISF
jgi:hypothetical protein